MNTGYNGIILEHRKSCEKDVCQVNWEKKGPNNKWIIKSPPQCRQESKGGMQEGSGGFNQWETTLERELRVEVLENMCYPPKGGGGGEIGNPRWKSLCKTKRGK